MTVHLKRSASESHRWIACPGSLRLSALVPRTTSPAASQGIMAHAAAEHCLEPLTSRSMADPNLPGTITYDDHGTWITATPDAEMMTHVQVLIGRVQELLRTYAPATLHLEQFFDLAHIWPDTGGTADVVITSKDRIIVIDYKHGFTPVHIVSPDGKTNTQLSMYGAGALHKYGTKATRYVQLEIVQPRCMEVEPVQSVTHPADDLRNWAESDLWEAAMATEAINAPLSAGEHCRFCPAAPACPALATEVSKLALVDFAEAVGPVTAPGTLGPAQIARILEWAPIIDAWLREVEAHAFNLMQAGHQVQGFKLVRKRADRTWPTDDPRELYALFKAAGFKGKQADLLNTSIKGIGKMEIAAGKKVVAQVAVKPEAGLTLAPDADKREAVEPGGDFANLDLLS